MQTLVPALANMSVFTENKSACPQHPMGYGVTRGGGK